jgi:hypothetical protein
MLQVKITVDREFDVFALLRRDDDTVDLSNIDVNWLQDKLNAALMCAAVYDVEMYWQDGLGRFSVRWCPTNDTPKSLPAAATKLDNNRVQMTFKYETVAEIKKILPKRVVAALKMLNNLRTILVEH